MNDWRLTGQEQYLKGKYLKEQTQKELKNKDETWHEHCEFCMDIISKSTVLCYCSEDEYRWVCPKCFADFKELFEWKIDKE